MRLCGGVDYKATLPEVRMTRALTPATQEESKTNGNPSSARLRTDRKN